MGQGIKINTVGEPWSPTIPQEWHAENAFRRLWYKTRTKLINKALSFPLRQFISDEIGMNNLFENCICLELKEESSGIKTDHFYYSASLLLKLPPNSADLTVHPGSRIIISSVVIAEAIADLERRERERIACILVYSALIIRDKIEVQDDRFLPCWDNARSAREHFHAYAQDIDRELFTAIRSGKFGIPSGYDWGIDEEEG